MSTLNAPVAQQDQPRRDIPSLDGLRALAIVLVLFGHLLGSQGFALPLSMAKPLDFGALGVRIFFVISGFLITSLLLAERERNGSIDLRRFYLRRTLRIFPPCYAYLCVLLLLGAFGFIELQSSDLVRAFAYVTNYGPSHMWRVGHTWSLSVEEQFYLLWPLALTLSLAAGRAWFWPTVALLVCPIARVIEFHYAPAGYVDRTFESTADALACGCLLALLGPWLRSNRHYARLQTHKAFFLIPALVLLAAAEGAHPHLSLLVCSSVQNVGIALCIHRVVLHPHGFVGRVLNARSVTALGRISYSLYLWQQLFLDRYTTGVLTMFPLSLALALAAAIASYQLIELPALRFRARLDKALFGDRPVALERPKPPITATSS